MTASPEVWRTINGWVAFYFTWMVLIGVMAYEGTIGIGWFLKFFS